MQRSVLRYAACVSVALLLAGVFCRPAMAGENITYPGVPLRPGLFDNAVNSIYPTAGFTGNTVTVYGGDIPGNVAGGVNFFEEDGTVSGNHVFFKDGVVGQNIIGAITNTGLASGNSVEISGGYVAGKSAGAVVLNVTDPAYGSVFLATDNSLTLTGGYVAQEVYGGYSVGSATNNRVVISGGTVGWSISGGFAGGYSGLAFEGDASGNSVTMSGGSVEGVSVPLHDNFLPDSGVYGGTSRTGNANDNTVHISGGTVVGHVSGGSRIQDLFNGTITGTAIRNTVTLSGNPNLTAAALFGGETIGTDDVFTGNTLNVFGFSGSVLGAANFQYYNLAIPAFMQNGGTVLNITGGVPVELAGTTVRVGIMGGGKHLTVGDSVTLISSADNAGPMSTQGMKGVSLLYDFDLNWAGAGSPLTATVAGVQLNPQTKALSEGRVAGLAFVNQGYDLLLGQGLQSAQLAAGRAEGKAVPFAAVQGGSSRYDTGSHVNVDGFSMMTGVAWSQDLMPHKITLGAFLELGVGNYDSHNSFNGFASVGGSGDTHYMGGGILARYDLTETALRGLYLDASFRAGGVDTDFSTGDLSSMAGEEANYNSSSAYYGAHAGLGYIWDITDKAALDFSIRYIWTRQAGDSVSVAGDPIHFKAVDSQRWRSGARFNYDVSDCITPYAGAYYDHEFDGKAKATTYGYSLDAPDLQGGTTVGELGITVSPVGKSWSVDVGVQGYTGVREGVTGSAQLKFDF